MGRGRGSEQCACVVDASWLAGLSEVCCCLAAFSKSASVVCSEQIGLKGDRKKGKWKS